MSEGKDRINISGSVVDAGWEQMQEILDLEMPRRRRKALVWWLLGGLLILGVGGVAALQDWSDPATKEEIMGVKDDILLTDANLLPAESLSKEGAISTQIDPDAKGFAASEKGLEKDQSEQANEAIARLPGRALQKQGNAAKAGGDPELTSVIRSTNASSAQPPVTEGTSYAGTPEGHLSDKNDGTQVREEIAPAISEKQEILSSESRMKLIREGFTVLEPIPSLPFEEPVGADQAVDIQALNSIVSTIKLSEQKFKPYLDVAARADLLSGFGLSQINAGGGLELQLNMSRRLSLSTGLAYWKLTTRQTIYASEASLAQDQIYFSADTEDASSVAEEERSSNTRMLLSDRDGDKFHFLEVPLYMSYRLSPRWDANLGVHWIGAVANPELAPLITSNSIAAPLFALSSISPQEIYRQSNFSYSAGLGYRFQRHFYVDLRFSVAKRHHLNYEVSQPSNESDRNLHHRLRIGVGYRFRSK